MLSPPLGKFGERGLGENDAPAALIFATTGASRGG